MWAPLERMYRPPSERASRSAGSSSGSSARSEGRRGLAGSQPNTLAAAGLSCVMRPSASRAISASGTAFRMACVPSRRVRISSSCARSVSEASFSASESSATSWLPVRCSKRAPGCSTSCRENWARRCSGASARRSSRWATSRLHRPASAVATTASRLTWSRLTRCASTAKLTPMLPSEPPAPTGIHDWIAGRLSS